MAQAAVDALSHGSGVETGFLQPFLQIQQRVLMSLASHQHCLDVCVTSGNRPLDLAVLVEQPHKRLKTYKLCVWTNRNCAVADQAAGTEGAEVSTGHWGGPLQHSHTAQCCCHAHSQPWHVSHSHTPAVHVVQLAYPLRYTCPTLALHSGSALALHLPHTVLQLPHTCHTPALYMLYSCLMPALRSLK